MKKIILGFMITGLISNSLQAEGWRAWLSGIFSPTKSLSRDNQSKNNGWGFIAIGGTAVAAVAGLWSIFSINAWYKDKQQHDVLIAQYTELYPHMFSEDCINNYIQKMDYSAVINGNYNNALLSCDIVLNHCSKLCYDQKQMSRKEINFHKQQYKNRIDEFLSHAENESLTNKIKIAKINKKICGITELSDEKSITTAVKIICEDIEKLSIEEKYRAQLYEKTGTMQADNLRRLNAQK